MQIFETIEISFLHFGKPVSWATVKHKMGNTIWLQIRSFVETFGNLLENRFSFFELFSLKNEAVYKIN